MGKMTSVRIDSLVETERRSLQRESLLLDMLKKIPPSERKHVVARFLIAIETLGYLEDSTATLSQTAQLLPSEEEASIAVAEKEKTITGEQPVVRVTDLVYLTLRESYQPLSPGQIVKRVRSKRGDIAKQSVYNGIKKLKDEKKIEHIGFARRGGFYVIAHRPLVKVRKSETASQS